MVTEQLERSREDCLQQKVQCSKKEAELEFTRERLSMAQSNLENFMKESAALRERGLQLANNLVQHQQTITTLRQVGMGPAGCLTLLLQENTLYYEPYVCLCSNTFGFARDLFTLFTTRIRGAA